MLKTVLAGATAGVALLAATVTPAYAAWPDHAVKVIVSLPPGSGADTTARFISQTLSKELGQPFVVENRPGANSFIAARAVAEAAPDGYTIFVASNSPMVTNAAVFSKLPYDPVKSFAPVASIARFPMVLVVPANSPFKTLQDLVAAAKRAPGRLNYASGTPTYQVAMERFHHRNGIKANPIQYKGTSPAINDLAGGNVDYSIAEISAVLPLIKGDKLRALAVGSDTRLKDLPDTPTVSESGTTGYEAYAWTGVFAPANTPANIVDKLSALVRKAMNSPEGAAFINNLGGILFTGTPAQLRDFQVKEIEATREIVKAANIPVE
ncbi:MULTISPECIES: Bug family tripartite tricarboxylate transporter substrate binding protein [Cupriavidus]|uniref:Tripartite tricarboxylate transporter substrate binding protein n=1 Tax=Cupriavidus metallidurans TaxID=119219 RepID=A0A2L0XC70_9BURK|nr:tripartite tricarboxylate transporter substrate binding protein [Cupriavidus metallidurans]KWR86917.1 ABC transporter substrate-binding protein [Cupriavidus sp. SHE]QBP14155.1 tripartite tricarboxylate transporter substrate binding protein [Cupriavidus metallidurans]QWC92605.1 tripartite tricarboxylate transporter substrate binding protein [Cupriavidus metallidurans]